MKKLIALNGPAKGLAFKVGDMKLTDVLIYPIPQECKILDYEQYMKSPTQIQAFVNYRIVEMMHSKKGSRTTTLFEFLAIDGCLDEDDAIAAKKLIISSYKGGE